MKNVHFALPEIYGETLSYYELLRNLVTKMNELIDNYNTVPEQITAEVKNLDAYSVFTTALNWLIHSIATDNTKSKDAVKQYKKHDLLYATFNDNVNLYEAITDFTNVFLTELKVGENIREVNISELLIELRKLIENEAQAREQADTALQTNIGNEAQAREQADTALQTNIDNEINTLRTMISSPYNFKGDVANISSLPASGEVNDTYYVQDVKYKVTWTGSAWVQSSLSEADYQKELSELKGDIDNKCVHWIPKKNIFNKDSSDKVDGFYVNVTSGYKNKNADWSAYILPVESGKTISINSNQIQCGFTSEYTDLSALGLNKQVNGWIGGLSGNTAIVVPDNAKYLTLSTVSAFLDSIQVEYNNISTEYEPYELVVPNTNELQEQIDNIDSSLENKIDYVLSKNIFNKDSSDKVDGFYINNINGKAYKNINSILSIFTVPVIGGEIISIKGCSNSAQYAFCSLYTNVATLATNGTLSGYISGSSFSTKLEGLVVPDSAKYLMISTNTSIFGNVQIEYNEKCTSYESYEKLIPTGEHIVKVGVEEDFETLKSGIEYATQFKNSIVKVKKGVYDLVEEFSSELETSKGLILKNNVHVIFEIGSKVTFNYTGDSQNIHVNFSPFNSGEYGFTIENLDLEASNCRYCVHDERGNSTDFYHNVYKNCRMKLDNSNNPDWVNPQNIGCGLANGIIEIENCRFNNWITFHNNNGTSTDSKSDVYVKDCYFENGGIVVGSYGNSTEISNFYISGNSLAGNITNQDTESTPNVNIELHEWNNEIRS